MFTKEFYELLTQIIKSWQVIAVSIALFLYLKIVSYVSRGYHPPRQKKIKTKRKSGKTEPVPAAGPEEGDAGSSSNEELGLEEA